MVHSLVSIKQVIAKVERDLGVRGEQVQWLDYIEWIAEGLNEIGAQEIYEEVEGLITVKDNKAKLPCNLIHIMELRYVAGTNQFGNPEAIKSRNMDIGKSTVPGTTVSSAEYNILKDTLISGQSDATYWIKYQAIPLDSDGLPMIADNDELKIALFWKVAYQLSIQGHEFRNAQMNNLQFLSMQWNKHGGRARADLNMPNPERVERWKNIWLSLPNKNMHDKGFKHLGTPEYFDLKFKG